MTKSRNYEDVACLPDCDEQHADDCPREKAELEYYRWYFGVGTAAFYNFAPEGCTCGEDRKTCGVHRG